MTKDKKNSAQFYEERYKKSRFSQQIRCRKFDSQFPTIAATLPSYAQSKMDLTSSFNDLIENISQSTDKAKYATPSAAPFLLKANELVQQLFQFLFLSCLIKSSFGK